MLPTNNSAFREGIVCEDGINVLEAIWAEPLAKVSHTLEFFHKQPFCKQQGSISGKFKQFLSNCRGSKKPGNLGDLLLNPFQMEYFSEKN